MSKEQVIELYSFVMPLENAETFVEEMFQVFDKDESGYLDFHVWTIQCNILNVHLIYRSSLNWQNLKRKGQLQKNSPGLSKFMIRTNQGQFQPKKC